MALPRSPWRRWRCALLVPTAALGTPIGGVVSCLAFPNGGSWDFPPRPRRVGCSPLAFDCALIRPRRGRSPFKVVVVCRRCVVGASLRLPYFRFAPITRFPRIPREGSGRRGRRSRPKPSAAFFVQASLAKELPRSVYRLAAGVAPESNEAGTIPRTANRETGVVCASRGLRLSASAILA